ncbi:hypothetical protein MMC14_000291 [Varicellaria rhodocarpa]|nr:hypothetical protein [Varicellaria rhodocarpa]
MSEEKSLCALISDLLADRDDLLNRLRYTQSTVEELEQQNKRLDIMLSDARSVIQEHVPGMNTNPKVAKPQRNSNNGVPTTWIGGSWLQTGIYELAPAEKSWLAGNKQGALSHVTQLVSYTLAPSLSIEAGLLLSALFRSMGNPEEGLIHAERSLRLAKDSGEFDQDLLGKAHFHSGLCFLHLARYADASWCFTLARSTKGHETEVEVNWELAQEARRRSTIDKRPIS